MVLVNLQIRIDGNEHLWQHLRNNHCGLYDSYAIEAAVLDHETNREVPEQEDDTCENMPNTPPAMESRKSPCLLN